MSGAEHTEAHAESGFDAGEVIIGHVSNSSIEHPILHLPTIFGIDFSITKHVLMLWIVATLVFVAITWTVRKIFKTGKSGSFRIYDCIRSSGAIYSRFNCFTKCRKKIFNTWTPLIFTFFFFIFSANAIGMFPIFDVIGAINRFIFGGSAHDHNLVNQYVTWWNNCNRKL